MIESRLRDQTRLWVSGISTDLRDAIHQEIDALRASIDQRVAALESVVSRNDEHLDRFAVDLHDLAAEEAQAAAAHVREEAQAAADSEIGAIRNRLQSDLEAARTEFENGRTALEAQIAQTERDVIAIRRKRDEQAASLDDAGKRIAALEEANAEIARMRQLADARLEEEIQRRTMVSKTLEAVRQEVLLAKAEADSCRLQARVAGERVAALESRTAPLHRNSQAVVERIKKGLEDLGTARPDEILSILLDHLSGSFATAAVFAVESNGLRIWKSRARDSAAALPDHVSLESESPLARALKHRVSVSADAASGRGTKGQPAGNVIALPVIVRERVIAVAYAESAASESNESVRVSETIAEILVGSVNRRLNRNHLSIDVQAPAEPERPVEPADNPSAAIEPEQYSVSRQAPRVKIAAVEVLVDGITSTLVDLSTLGVQVISPTALRPNRCVRLVLPSGGSRVNCEGRIVWAHLEAPRADAPAMYRAGVRFVDVNVRAITTFMSQYGPAEAAHRV